MHWELYEAEEWILKLPTADEDQRRAFVAWIKASPENVKAFLLSTALATEIKGKPLPQLGDPLPRVRASSNVLKFPVRLSSQVNSHGVTSGSSRVPSKPLRWVCIAASVIVALLIAQLMPRYLARTIEAEFATHVGERRTVSLPDGTSFQLDTNSSVVAHYTAGQRDLCLGRGEIWINVAKDRRRPFRVIAGGVQVRDIGTIFDVRTSPTETGVYVLKGRVRLSAVSPNTAASIEGPLAEPSSPSVEIGGGDEAVIKTTENGVWAAFTARRLSSQESDKRIAWTRGLLMFTGESLRDVVREVNRYQGRHIVIVDPSLENLSIGGTIDPTGNAYRILMRFMRQMMPKCDISVDASDPSTIQLRTDKRLGCRSEG